MRLLNRLVYTFHLFYGSHLSRDAQLRELVVHLRERNFDFLQFFKKFKYHPRNWRFLFQALVHRSYLQFLPFAWESNERLEFLGDSVLNFIIAEQLFFMFPKEEEGELTKLRSRLVNKKILAQCARDLHLSDFLLLSNSAAQSIGSGAESILADAFEALIGALYIDGGIAIARRFVQDHVMTTFETVRRDDNYKSALLEYAQAHELEIPHYVVVKEDGPEHDRRFTIEVLLGMQSLGSGTGRNKKEAEQIAAAQALEKLQQTQLIKQQHHEHNNTSK